MKEKMLLWLVGMIFERLDGEDLKVWADKGLDLIEDKVAASATKYDDKIVLPMCRLMREAFSIPDNDE